MYLDSIIASEDFCPNCRAARLKTWHELSEDEKSFIRYLPAGAKFGAKERERHLFCTKCGYESAGEKELKA